MKSEMIKLIKEEIGYTEPEVRCGTCAHCRPHAWNIFDKGEVACFALGALGPFPVSPAGSCRHGFTPKTKEEAGS